MFLIKKYNDNFKLILLKKKNKYVRFLTGPANSNIETKKKKPNQKFNCSNTAPSKPKDESVFSHIGWLKKNFSNSRKKVLKTIITYKSKFKQHIDNFISPINKKPDPSPQKVICKKKTNTNGGELNCKQSKAATAPSKSSLHQTGSFKSLSPEEYNKVCPLMPIKMWAKLWDEADEHFGEGNTVMGERLPFELPVEPLNLEQIPKKPILEEAIISSIKDFTSEDFLLKIKQAESLYDKKSSLDAKFTDDTLPTIGGGMSFATFLLKVNKSKDLYSKISPLADTSTKKKPPESNNKNICSERGNPIKAMTPEEHKRNKKRLKNQRYRRNKRERLKKKVNDEKNKEVEVAPMDENKELSIRERQKIYDLTLQKFFFLHKRLIKDITPENPQKKKKRLKKERYKKNKKERLKKKAKDEKNQKIEIIAISDDDIPFKGLDSNGFVPKSTKKAPLTIKKKNPNSFNKNFCSGRRNISTAMSPEEYKKHKKRLKNQRYRRNKKNRINRNKGLNGVKNQEFAVTSIDKIGAITPEEHKRNKKRLKNQRYRRNKRLKLQKANLKKLTNKITKPPISTFKGKNQGMQPPFKKSYLTKPDKWVHPDSLRRQQVAAVRKRKQDLKEYDLKKARTDFYTFRRKFRKGRKRKWEKLRNTWLKNKYYKIIISNRVLRVKKKPRPRRLRKPWTWRKKNKVFGLLGIRKNKISIAGNAFRPKLKDLKYRLELIQRVFLRFWSFKKGFFKKYSSLSFIKKIRKNNYLIKSKKSRRFFYILERRLLILLKRLRLLKKMKVPNAHRIIRQGHVYINNQAEVNPNYLVPYDAVISTDIWGGMNAFKVNNTNYVVRRRYFKRYINKVFRPISLSRTKNLYQNSRSLMLQKLFNPWLMNRPVYPWQMSKPKVNKYLPQNPRKSKRKKERLRYFRPIIRSRFITKRFLTKNHLSWHHRHAYFGWRIKSRSDETYLPRTKKPYWNRAYNKTYNKANLLTLRKEKQRVNVDYLKYRIGRRRKVLKKNPARLKILKYRTRNRRMLVNIVKHSRLRLVSYKKNKKFKRINAVKKKKLYSDKTYYKNMASLLYTFCLKKKIDLISSNNLYNKKRKIFLKYFKNSRKFKLKKNAQYNFWARKHKKLIWSSPKNKKTPILFKKTNLFSPHKYFDQYSKLSLQSRRLLKLSRKQKRVESKKKLPYSKEISSRVVHHLTSPLKNKYYRDLNNYFRLKSLYSDRNRSPVHKKQFPYIHAQRRLFKKKPVSRKKIRILIKLPAAISLKRRCKRSKNAIYSGVVAKPWLNSFFFKSHSKTTGLFYNRLLKAKLLKQVSKIYW